MSGLWPIALVPLALQAVAMLVDELRFHRRRGLSRWERVGHPLDTASVLACYAVAIVSPPTDTALTVYVGLSAFSCLLITKDERVHARECGPEEHWLHALLFVLHPIVLGAVAFLWLGGHRAILHAQAALTTLFGGYQLLYWNTGWIRHSRAR